MSITKKLRKKGIVWEVRLQDSRGKSYYKCFSKKSFAQEYEKVEKLKKLQGYVLSTDNKKRKYTVRDLCDKYTHLYFPKLREGSIISYTNYMNNHIVPHLGEIRVGSVKKEDVTKFENFLLKSGFSIQTVHNIIYFFLTLMNYASDELHWIEKNLIRNYKAKKIEKDSSFMFWELDDIENFFNHPDFHNNYYKDLYLFLLNTGCRIGESGALRVGDVDFGKNRIYIGWTLAKNNHKSDKYKGIYFSLNRQKGANGRYVPMNNTVRVILTKLCEDRTLGDFVFTNQPNEKRDIVYRDGSNKEVVISASVINSQHFSNTRFSKLQERTGIDPLKKLGAHGLRHTFASHYVMNGGSLYALSKLLGHSSIKITEIYAHLSPDYLRNVGDFVDFDYC